MSMSPTDNPDPAGPPAEPGLKLEVEAKLGWLDDLRLIAFRGYGTRRSLHLSGRLIEAKGAKGGSGADGGVIRNVIRTLHRMESDEIPGARLRARFRDHEHELYTDDEGYFQLNLYVDRPLDAGWNQVHLELVESIAGGARAEATAEVLVPSEEAEFVVVSDLDDTVIRSSATDKLEQARMTLFHDAASRVPFAGVAELYRALIRGPDERGVNPLFYLSRSGWNLYDLFEGFLEAHEIPKGPMFLRDLAFREDKSSALGSKHHKLARIRDLLQLYPDLPFVLIGDSGQGDLQKYRQIAIENPGRVRAVYVRDVTDERDRELAAAAADLERRGVPTLMSETTAAIAEHMRAHDLVAEGALAEVREAEERRKDEEPE
jgi:phosphatidate phosphatase APP1